MGYADGYPIRPVGGRLALDFINTADWDDDGAVVHEKFETLEDVVAWLAALGLPHAKIPENVSDIRARRAHLRRVIQGKDNANDLLSYLDDGQQEIDLRHWPVLDLMTISTLALVADPREMERVKTCPGDDCGWIFFDETKNRRRKWCMMETCGNRAKAARHYKRTRVRQGKNDYS